MKEIVLPPVEPETNSQISRTGSPGQYLQRESYLYTELQDVQKLS